MRNTSIADHDLISRPIVAIGNDYAYGHCLPLHVHRRSQLLYGATGIILVDTAEGSWMVPPQRAVWIPGGTPHEVRMLGVTTRSLYVEPDARPDLPKHCQVVEVSPLLRQLLLEAVDLPSDYDLSGRDGLVMSLLLQDIGSMPVLPLHLPLPTDVALLALCRRFLAAPVLSDASPERWSTQLAISRRSFTRLFKLQTGLSFAEWRQRSFAIVALPRLNAGEAVTTVAMDLGYDSPAAFTAMFTRVLGMPPRHYQSRNGQRQSPLSASADIFGEVKCITSLPNT